MTFEGPVKEYGSKARSSSFIQRKDTLRSNLISLFSLPCLYFLMQGDSGNVVTRKFCSVCGSSLSHGSDALGGKIAVHTGSFHDDFVKAPYAAEVYVKDK